MKPAYITDTQSTNRQSPSPERVLRLRAGRNGAGRILKSVIYWPESGQSIDKAYAILEGVAARHDYEIVGGDRFEN